MKHEKEKKTFSMRMVLNVFGLFAFIGMTVGAYTQAYYLVNTSKSAALYT
ncbi:hypothetical protein [Bacillus haynesii]|nr:hypothetical protein [Bacillus haynesii]MCY8739620.1 hypothetical protein [Bacillus haynesii]